MTADTVDFGDGTGRYWVTSAAIILADWEGEIIARIAVGNDGTQEAPYVLERVIRLSGDLADPVNAYAGLLFQLPYRPITMLLHGSRL